MSYHQQPEQARGTRQGPPYPILGANGGAAAAAAARAPAAGVYGMPQYQQAEGYGGPPPSPVVAQSWDRGYVSGLDESYMRQQDPQGILPTTGTPLASGTSGSGETQFLVSGGGANAMGAPLQSYYPPSLYGVPASMYPFPPQAGFHGQYAGGGAGGAGAAGSAGAGAGSTAAGNFYGQGGYARSTNPGQPIQTTTNLQGPDGCNLFVFHIPNTMTNEALFRLFSKFGNVISARIMVEKATGRSRGFGFVSYDNRDSAEKAISQMNGYQIEHKRLKVQHKKDKERDRYVGAPSPTQRLMGAAGGVVPAGRVQQAPHFRQPLLPQHAGLRHHGSTAGEAASSSKLEHGITYRFHVMRRLQDVHLKMAMPGHGDGSELMQQTQAKVGDDKPPPPSPAADGGANFPGQNAEGDLQDGQTNPNDVGIEGSGDPAYGSRAGGGDKYGRPNDHPHLAYIYRGRGTQPTDDGEGQEEGENSYLGAAPASSVGGARRAASPDPKPDGRSGSPSAQAAASAAAAVSAAAVAAAAAMPHQSLEHAMQTKLSLGGSGSSPASAQPS